MHLELNKGTDNPKNRFSGFYETFTSGIVEEDDDHEPIIVKFMGADCPTTREIKRYIEANKGYDIYTGRTGSGFFSQPDMRSRIKTYEQEAPNMGVEAEVLKLSDVPESYIVKFRIKDREFLESIFPDIDRHIRMSPLEKQACLLQRALIEMDEEIYNSTEEN